MASINSARSPLTTQDPGRLAIVAEKLSAPTAAKPDTKVMPMDDRWADPTGSSRSVHIRNSAATAMKA